jgi:hypothetical protein
MRALVLKGFATFVPVRQPFAALWEVITRWLELPVLCLGLLVLFVIFPLDDMGRRKRRGLSNDVGSRRPARAIASRNPG